MSNIGRYINPLTDYGFKKMRAYTLELADYRGKAEKDCKTKIDYWLYNLVNMESMTMNIPFQNQQPIFTKVGGIAELIHMSAEERSRYNISLDSYRTNLSAMKNERAEGRAEGLQEGLEKGRQEERQKAHAKALESARSLKTIGVLSTTQIAEILGLSEEEVEES